MDIGEIIKKKRVELGLSQKRLGELCEPPIDASHIRRIESGRTKPTADTIERISKALGREFAVSNRLFRYPLNKFDYIQDMNNMMTWTSDRFLLEILCKKEGIEVNDISEENWQYDYSLQKDEICYQFDQYDWSNFFNRVMQHARIDFKAFLEEHKDDGEQNHDQSEKR